MQLPDTIDQWLAYIKHYPQFETMPPTHAAQFIQFLITHETQPGGPYVFNGSTDKTANAVIRAYLQDNQSPTITPVALTLQSPWGTIWNTIVQRFSLHPQSDIYQTLLKLFRSLASTDIHGEISHFSRTFYRSLTKKPALTPSQLDALDSANCYTWLTYSILDAITDNASHTHLVAIAHFTSRTAFDTYAKEHLSTAFLHSYYAACDEALVRERLLAEAVQLTTSDSVHYKQTPSREITRQLLWQKSCAHLAGPATIVALSPYSTDEKDAIIRGLQAYCTLRQFNDDMHDWLDDITEGTITYPLACLLDAADQSRQRNGTTLDLHALKTLFFKQTATTCVSDLLRETAPSLASLSASHLFSNDTFVNAYVAPYRQALRTFLSQHAFAASFVAAYDRADSSVK